jgi:hypothetical protein
MSGFSDTSVSFEEVVGATRKSQPEAVVAALHELSERLTAANNYIASSRRLSELGHAERLGKALRQLERAGEILNSLRKLLQEEAP